MRIVKYYDRINRKMLELEVSDEVAKFLHANNRKQSRQIKKDWNFIEFSLDDTPDFSEEDDSVSYHELVADENVDIERTFEEKQFSEIVWKVVDKLIPIERKTIRLYFLHGYKAKQVAYCVGKSESNFNGFMQTCLGNLRHYFTYDENFATTAYYEEHYNEFFAEEVVEQARQKLSQPVLRIDLNAVEDLMKRVTQTNKKSTQLQIEKPKETQKFLTMMTDVVRDFFKELKNHGKYNKNEQNFLNVPLSLLENFMPNNEKDKDKDKNK